MDRAGMLRVRGGPFAENANGGKDRCFARDAALRVTKRGRRREGDGAGQSTRGRHSGKRAAMAAKCLTPEQGELQVQERRGGGG